VQDQHIMHRLKLRELRILLAVTQAGSMAKAATQLAISQPAVSRAIADMEAALGVSLLNRSSQGVEPTPYGHALIKRAVAVFDELRHYAGIRIMPRRWMFVLVIGLSGPAYRHNQRASRKARSLSEGR